MNDLYKWKKHDSRLKARMKDSDSIQAIHQWLRKVENVTDNAISKVCKDDTNLGVASYHTNSHRNQYLSSQNLNIHTEAHTEAHDLLNKWVTDKIRLDMDDDIYNYVNINEMNKFEKNSKYLEELLNDANENSTTGLLHISGLDYDKYDESYIAKDIVNEMMKKKYVDPANILKLDEKKAKPVDIGTKIQMRHQMVKENREKRLKEIEEKRKEKLAKKEAELQAKQLVMKEEHEKRVRMNIEQQLLEQEVERLRKEMIEQRKKEDELKQRQQEMEIMRIERENQEYLNQKRLLEITSVKAEADNKRREMEEKRNEDLLQSYLKAKNMRILQKTFSAWFDIVVDLKLKTGKARALYDWKISYRYFNAWKKLNLAEKIRKQQKVHEDIIKIENIKISKAINYYNMKLVRRCMETWHVFVRNEKANKKINEEKNKAKSKMQMFLEAAAQGKLNITLQDESKSELVENENQSSELNTSKKLAPKSQRSARTITTKTTLKQRPKSASSTTRNQSMKTPTTQFNESTINDADQFENSDLALMIPDTDREAQMSRQVRKMMWPFVKTPFIINNFENRYKAHEKLLQEQQKMIKEQQRLIEDLKYQQNQIAFKEQIALLEQIKQKQDELERMQKAQYNQEKKVLMMAAYAKNQNKSPNSKNEADNTTVNNTDEIIDLEDTSFENNENHAETTIQNDQHEQSKLTNQTLNQNSETSFLSKTPRYLKNMEERAKQREQVKREREERKRQQEVEKLKQLQLKQEEKMRQEEEEKRKRNEELKEKRRIEKDLKEKRDAEKRREQELNDKADRYYKKYLMRHYCLNGFRKLMEIRENQAEMAIKHYQHTLLRKCINEWKVEINEQINIKMHIANKFYKKYLLRHYFVYGWKNFKMSLRFEEAKAVRFYKFNLKVKIFNTIRLYTEKEKVKFREYDKWIDNYSNQKLKQKYFKKWKEYPDEMKKLREREKRLIDMRKKVQEFLPDFNSKTSLTESTSTVRSSVLSVNNKPS